jgi:NAD(P)-dependent dehydrogenase (short-subunit alcohol dehydrogenase family)
MREVDGRNAEPAASLKSLAARDQLRIRVVELDVTNEQSAQKAVEAVVKESGSIDVLVNNAGLMSIGLAEGFTEEQARHQMDVNFLGPFRLSRAVLPHMRGQRSGLLIHVTSIVGRIIFPGAALYCASKFAQEALAEALHYELTGTGVESVIVQPGPYPTSLLANSPGPKDTERVAAYGELASLRETVIGTFSQLFASEASPQPQEVADAIARLIDLSAGDRPLRTVCGLDYGACAINDLVAPVQAEVLRALGMGQMVAPLATAHTRRASAS